jgi:hypothetical protein
MTQRRSTQWQRSVLMRQAMSSRLVKITLQIIVAPCVIHLGKFAIGHCYFLAFAETHCSIVSLLDAITIL